MRWSHFGTRVPLTSIVLALTVVLASVFATTAVGNDLPQLEVVHGTPVDFADLDGVIGPEWNDADQQQMTLGKYKATILLKHDGEFVYIGMVIETGEFFPYGFEAYVVFDNGDRVNFSEGDDIISAYAEDGVFYEADFYYLGLYEFYFDPDVGGQNNAYGAGAYNAQEKSYVFEFAKELASDDSADVDLISGDVVPTICGWASY